MPAIIPLYLAWWLLTEYMPMDCKSTEDLAKPDLVNCDYTTLDHSPVVMYLLAVTSVFTLALVVAVDVFLPLGRGQRLAAWLGTATLIPLPFVVLLVLS
ncbi:hypothetical protein [Nonomuraea aridisoli]|uniref:Uncharacterized protein n=1 Tax=Nonomuraea aridisoli TaxID=2070368 RepID=A0A2W2EXG1_9ACTN|nr:hypothetical protein [Nonomuraea aridisoli]PZG20945.1 hypothetical protein C1J01_08085 [Nonomuraea aridisoli]